MLHVIVAVSVEEVALAINEMIAMEHAAVFLFAVSGGPVVSAAIARLVVWHSGVERGCHPFPSFPAAPPPLFRYYYRIVFTLFLRHRKRNAD